MVAAMRGRSVVVVVCVALLAGCGDGGGGGDAVRVHVSEALPGSDDYVRAYRMALRERGGRAGDRAVELVVHDVSGESQGFDVGLARKNAQAAADDERAVAYLGESNSGACATSAPILNEAGIVQVSAGCSYQGLTRSEGAEADEPGLYRPSGTPTFARTIASDLVQGEALVAAVQRKGLERPVLIVAPTLYGSGLARAFRIAARAAGLRHLEGSKVFGDATPDRAVPLIRKAGADSVVFAGELDPAIAKFQAETAPDLPLFTGDAAADRPFLESVGSGGNVLRITAPLTGRGAAAEAFAERYREQTGRDIADVRIYNAYESMRVVLDAIERAGARGRQRRAVRDALFGAGPRDSVLGRYAIDRHGDPTVETYGLYRVRDRKLELEATLKLR
jgi:branched-chain amino acid transport system substrate-binding protein